MEEDKHKETAQINELLNKIKILKNGVLEERKKSQVYLNRIKEYEKTLQLKDAEVAQIIKEKYQLDLALQSEKSKKKKKSFTLTSVMDKIFHKEKFSKDKLDKIKEENNKITEANTEMETKIKEEEDLYIQEKSKYQALLTLKANKLKELQAQIKIITEQKQTLDKQCENMRDKKNEYDNNKMRFEEKLNEMSSQLKDSKKQLRIKENMKHELDERLQNVENDFKTIKQKLDEVTDEVREVNSISIKKNATKREFKAKKIGKVFSDALITITFQKVEDTNLYVIKFGDDLNINFTSITSFAPNDKIPNRFDIAYNGEDGKEKKLSFIIHERLKDSITQWFNDFLSEAFSNA